MPMDDPKFEGGLAYGLSVSVTNLSRYTLESGDRSLQIVFGSQDASLPNLWVTRLGVSGT